MPQSSGSKSVLTPDGYTIDTAREWAKRYFDIGLNPLPSRLDMKRPAMTTYAQERDNGCPWLEWSRRSSPVNVQLATGSRWGFVVLEVDGDEAQEILATWTLFDPLPATWECASGSGRSIHYYFAASLPIASRISQGALWLGNEPHVGIELLGDSALAMVPPSIHPKTGQPYTWTRSPWDTKLAPMPAWLKGMLVEPVQEAAALRAPARPSLGPLRPFYRCEDVRAALGDPVDLLRSWGVQIVSKQPNAAGWLQARSIFRQDRHPSAMVSAKTGDYWESDMGRNSMNLFKLGVVLGIYPDTRHAVDDLGHTYLQRNR